LRRGKRNATRTHTRRKAGRPKNAGRDGEKKEEQGALRRRKNMLYECISLYGRKRPSPAWEMSPWAPRRREPVTDTALGPQHPMRIR
jgi:hypothetical protein